MINFQSVGDLAHTAVDGDFDNSIFMQVGDTSKGVDIFYCNTAESMGVKCIEININANTN